MEGYIIRGLGGLYTVKDACGAEYVLRCMKKIRRQHLSPLVGDQVVFTPGEGEEHGWLEEIRPRKTECVRPPVANVELVLLVVAPVPAPDMMLIDRLLIRARQQGMSPVLVMNKREMDDGLGERLTRDYRRAEVPVVQVSAREGLGLDELRRLMAGRLCCVAGQSGVGKSTLLNALLDLSLETGVISDKIQRGKNTTRHTELYEKNGLRVLDTAGFSLLELEERMEPVALMDYYPEFEPYLGQCRFAPCYHLSEPGCAVLAAAQAGEISPERLARYHELLKAAKEAWRNRYD